MRHKFLQSTATFSILASIFSGCVAPPSSSPVTQLFEQTTTQSQSISETSNALSPEQQLLATLPSRGVAPELFNETWLNSAPLKLAALRGKVVMIDFWTFDCINCIHTTPSLIEWYNSYHDQGFEMIGVHAPEFAHEKVVENVQAACERLGVTWPVAIDNDFATWKSYGNHYWPAMYLIDKQGNIRYYKIGEGGYEKTEAIIQALLSEAS